VSTKLAPSTESLVQAQIDSGRYRDADEVIRKAVALLVSHEHELEEFRRSIQETLDELHAGGGEYYTPELRREMKESALRRLKDGDRPNNDILP
jgi:putative addiction module CopG family antidote